MSRHYRKDPQALNALTEIQFNVTQKNATERPFTGEYDKHFDEGCMSISFPASPCSPRGTNLIPAAAGPPSAGRWKITSAT
jgi:hypothetical protein